MVLAKIGNYQRGQVETPFEIISFFWQVLEKYRPSLGYVFDMGCGDGRFSLNESYERYIGYEIDKSRKPLSDLSKKVKIKYDCVFNILDNNVTYDGSIGNPPYVRRYDIGLKWREEIHSKIKDKLGFSLNMQCNLFVYFMCLGLIKTKPNGIVALIVPFEWVSRPSATELRNYIKEHGWGVHVYKFEEEIFHGFLTTASISIIDKADKSGEWKYYSIDKNHTITSLKNVTGTDSDILDYCDRSDIWAMRGLSPGTQKVFTLTEGERIHNGLQKKDVVPCVTSLRELPITLDVLDEKSFLKYFVLKGQRCWLIKTDSTRKKINGNLKRYLDGIPQPLRDTTTCNNRELWFRYPKHPEPDLLYASGFTDFGPKIIINKLKAVPVGSVHGIHSVREYNKKKLHEFLKKICFEARVVAHAGSLKKIEVKQMNSILLQYMRERLKA